MLMTGVIPDTFSGSSSFLDEEIEYLELESLIDEIADRLEASWSYNLEEETYQVEFIDDEGTLHEAVSISMEFCQEGFNEGRDLIICSVVLGEFDASRHLGILPEFLRLAGQLIFSKVFINEHQQLQLMGKCLYHQELALDVLTTLVEEMSSLAADFRLKLESANSAA
ncbi:MAG: hypothetical protein ACAI44_10730 [Candidatus Sericytochromatia bacterium]